MAFTIYKPGQGYWTRVLSAVGAATLVMAAVAWIWNELEVLHQDYGLYIRAGSAIAIILICGGVLWRVMNRPPVVDFMIATDAEMRKVNWPTKREILASTWIVICGTILMALMLFLVDIGFAKLFQSIGILEG